MKHLISFAEELASKAKERRESNWSRIFELNRILAQEIAKLSADDFQDDARAEFLSVQDRFRTVAGKSTWTIEDCPALYQIATRVAAVLNKQDAQGGRNGPSMTKIEIKNFQGILGNVIEITVEQNLSLKVTKRDFQALSDALQEIGLGEDDIAALKTALQKDPEPEKPDQYGPEVSGWLGKTMQKIAGGAYELSIATGGGVIAELLLKYYGFH